MKIFGFEIKRTDRNEFETNSLADLSSTTYKELDTIVSPENEDGAIEISSLHNSYQLGSFTQNSTESDLIKQYRDMASQPEVDQAIDEIVNEAIVLEDNFEVVTLNLDNLDYSDKIKGKIRDEFAEIVRLLKFNTDAYNIFRKWYIDGRLYYNIVIDFNNPKLGIQKLLAISPFHIKKVREIVKERNENNIEVVRDIKEYYLYDDVSNFSNNALKIPLDSVVYVHSGLLDEDNNIVISYLNKAIKAINQLRMMEDALIIYRLARAPERRVFYVDVGNLSKIKGEQYIKSLMAKFKNRMVYDAVTGKVKDSRNQLSMMEDFWIPRRSEGKTTEIQTLPGACLDMNTLVKLSDGRDLSITDIAKELAEGHELWTYSCHPETGEQCLGLISWAGVTKTQVKVMQLSLDNGQVIFCTPDHKFPIVGKGFVEAKYLMNMNSEFMSPDGPVLLVAKMCMFETIDVGTLTIDQEERFHNYHTFLLSAGVYTKNSNTDNTAEINYFLNRMYSGLNIPTARFNGETASTFSLGRQAEITRDELKFSKFIRRLQAQFSNLFYYLLRVQLLLKNIIDIDDWDDIKNDIKFVYEKDNFYTDTKNAAILKDKLEILSSIDPFVGKFVSEEFVYKHVLNMNEEEIAEVRKQMKEEAKNKAETPEAPEAEDNMLGDASPEPEAPEAEPEASPEEPEAPEAEQKAPKAPLNRPTKKVPPPEESDEDLMLKSFS